MDIDYLIEQDQIFFVEGENKKDKVKKKKKALIAAEDNLWKMAKDRINGEAGEGWYIDLSLSDVRSQNK